MTKILVISDTHQNMKLLSQVLKREEAIDYLFHLGDEGEDLQCFEEDLADKEIYHVPGVYHDNYLNENKRVLSINIEDVNFKLVHRLEDCSYSSNKKQVILYGHTHKPDFMKDQNTILVNPGHLKRVIDRNNTASYLLLNVENAKINFQFKDYEGYVFINKEIQF